MRMRFFLNKNLVKILFRTYSICIFMLLQGCNPNNIGQELSNSFDQPETQPKLNTKSLELEKPKLVKSNKNSSNSKSIDKEKKPMKIAKKRKSLGLKKVTYTPRPYRITIKLSGANPSSPSESVTNALIKAGVKFEVEMIERIEEGDFLKNSSNRGNRR